jgi:hypothetical protein
MLGHEFGYIAPIDRLANRHHTIFQQRAYRLNVPQAGEFCAAAASLVLSASSSLSGFREEPSSVRAEIPCRIPCKKLTSRTRQKAMRRRSIITVGSGDEEIKIYTLRRKDGYPSLQCAWYELGQRRSLETSFASASL